MNAVILPSKPDGRVKVPASKSAAHRAMIAAALSDRETLIRIDALNADALATISCLRSMGAEVERLPGALRISPVVPVRGPGRIDCGESGSTLRFLVPVACALGLNARFTGHGRLPMRPNRALTEALRAHGATIDNDLLPMNVSGALKGGVWTLPGDVSSQYITGLLFALPMLYEDSDIVLTTPLESAAYVDMTISALRRFGISVQTTSTGWHVPGAQTYRSPGELAVEGDWSAAAFWVCANAMGASIAIDGVSDDTMQGDRAVLQLAGKPGIDARHVPDLVPALAACAAVLPQTTRIYGAARLRLKESDRLRTTADMIRALGGSVEVTDDGLIIDGGRPIRSGTVDGANDHRIVMAAAILATHADGPVTITDAEAVNKSYPDFWRDFERLGGHIHVESAGQ